MAHLQTTYIPSVPAHPSPNCLSSTCHHILRPQLWCKPPVTPEAMPLIRISGRLVVCGLHHFLSAYQAHNNQSSLLSYVSPQLQRSHPEVPEEIVTPKQQIVHPPQPYSVPCSLALVMPPHSTSPYIASKICWGPLAGPEAMPATRTPGPNLSKGRLFNHRPLQPEDQRGSMN